MEENPFTQKQISRKYWGNLGYFRKPHYLRKVRTWVFVATVVCSFIGVLTFRFWGRPKIFSKGPISQNHAFFAHDCRACHIDAESDLVKALLSEKPSHHSLSTIFATGSSLESTKNGHLPDGNINAVVPAARSLMDQACLKCHPAAGLHLPQAAGVALRAVSNELAVVHATNCFVCHREHIGHERMALPDSQTCMSCHNNADELRRARSSMTLNVRTVSSTGENLDLGDGLVRFITPARTPGSLKSFTDYAHGHPPFGYEEASLHDPADLKFNHARHRRADIVALGQGQKLDCADCHKPGPGGVYYQPVSYARNCQQCHTLQIQPSLPKLLIPHGDPEKVRYFLASLDMSIEQAIRTQGVSDPEVSKRVTSEMQNLGRRSLADLEQRVFFDGDPKDNANDRRAQASKRKFLTECAKCHTVSRSEASGAPKVSPPNIAQRWAQRGLFTHMPHQHMACADCHKAAETSQKTSDILLPSQKLCAECHRPPGMKPLSSTGDALTHRAFLKPDSIGSATTQRETGGIKWDCQSCHAFHAPPDAVKLIHAAPNPFPQPAEVSTSYLRR